MTLKTPQEVENWFLSHSSGSVLVEKGGKTKLCNSYPEAIKFLEE